MSAKGTLERLRQNLVKYIWQETAGARAHQRTLVYLIRLGMHMGRKFASDECPQRAGSLAYATILSLVPATALLMLYFKAVGRLDAMGGSLQDWVLRTFVAESAGDVARYIDQFIGNLHTRALGTIGIVGMLVTTYSVFRTVEISFDRIWDVRDHRSPLTRFQILCSMLVVVPAFLFLSFYITGRAQASGWFGRYQDWVDLVLLGTPLFMSATAFFVLFKWVPFTRVHWRPAFIAALVTALLFESAKTAFNFYVQTFLAVSKIYGSLGLIPIFLLWIYISWIIVLFGVELTYTIQNLKNLHERALERKTPSPLAIALHEEWGLRMFEAFLKRFRDEGPVAADVIADDVGIPVPRVEDHFQVLCEAKLLARTEDESRTYVASRPIEDLSPDRIMNAFRERLRLPPRKSSRLKDV